MSDGTSHAMVGTGTTISFSKWLDELSAPVPVIVLEVTPPEYTKEKIETTHMGTRTTQNITDEVPGFGTSLPSALIDPGEASMEIAFQPEHGIPPIGIMQRITITFPDTTVWAFDGFVTNFSPSVPLEDRMTASITIQATGSVDSS